MSHAVASNNIIRICCVTEIRYIYNNLVEKTAKFKIRFTRLG